MEIIVLLVVIFIVAYLYKTLGEIGQDQADAEALAKIPLVQPSVVEKSSLVPEDSVLKRHFLTHLKAEIEAELHPRPTCSTLKRHYDSLVKAEMERRMYQSFGGR